MIEIPLGYQKIRILSLENLVFLHYICLLVMFMTEFDFVL